MQRNAEGCGEMQRDAEKGRDIQCWTHMQLVHVEILLQMRLMSQRMEMNMVQREIFWRMWLLSRRMEIRLLRGRWMRIWNPCGVRRMQDWLSLVEMG